MGGFSFDVGLQRMRCKRLQGKALGPKIRTSEDPTISNIIGLSHKAFLLGSSDVNNPKFFFLGKNNPISLLFDLS